MEELKQPRADAAGGTPSPTLRADATEGTPSPTLRAAATEGTRRPLERRFALRVSLAVNVVLAAIALAVVARRWWNARLPPRPDVYAEERRSVHAALPARPKAIVFLGDSLTERGLWSELLGEPSILNRGISGDTTAGLLARAAGVAANDPASVFLLAGVNDLAAGEPVPAIAKRYGEILDVLRTSAPRARLYCESVLPVRQRAAPPAAPPAMTNARIRELNEALRGVAASRSCTFVDLGPALSDESGALDARFTLDGVHLTGAGYAAWARAIAPLVSAPR